MSFEGCLSDLPMQFGEPIAFASKRESISGIKVLCLFGVFSSGRGPIGG